MEIIWQSVVASKLHLATWIMDAELSGESTDKPVTSARGFSKSQIYSHTVGSMMDCSPSFSWKIQIYNKFTIVRISFSQYWIKCDQIKRGNSRVSFFPSNEIYEEHLLLSQYYITVLISTNIVEL